MAGEPDGPPSGSREELAQGEAQNWPEAVVDVAKFRDYSMDRANPRNRGKFQAFEALGYDVSTPKSREAAAQDVIRQLRDALPGTNIKVDPSRWGQRFGTATPITGPNSRSGTLRAWWQVDPGAKSPRMITNWVEVHPETED